MQVQIPADLPMSVPGFCYCSRTVRNLWKMLDIENRRPFHRMLDFGTFLDRNIGIEHTHLARVHAQLNTGAGGRINLTFINRRLYFVIVCERGECARLEDPNLQT